MSEGQPPRLLTQMNSVIRRIDLICKLFAPVVSGFIISFISLRVSAMTLAVLNTTCVWLEYWFFMSVYKGIPALVERNLKRTSRPSPVVLLESSLIQNGNPASAESNQNQNFREKISKIPFIGAWKLYLEQEVVLPGVSLALLYFTVLR